MVTRKMKLAAAIAAAITLSGCAGVSGPWSGTTSGMATYSLQKKGTDCTIRIASGREVEGGSLEIGKDCTVKAKARSLNGAESQLMMLDALSKAMERIPSAPLVSPAP